jgi:hypothetical protein
MSHFHRGTSVSPAVPSIGARLAALNEERRVAAEAKKAARPRRIASTSHGNRYAPSDPNPIDDTPPGGDDDSEAPDGDAG